MSISLHRVRFSLDLHTHIELEWIRGKGGQASPLPIPAATLTELELEPDTSENIVPAMCWRADTPVLFEQFQLRENTDYFIDLTIPMSVNDIKARMTGQPGWPFSARFSNIFKPDPPRRWAHNQDGTTTISGQLRLRNHAGILNLSPDPTRPIVVEIVCRKLGYLDEFKALLDDVAAEMTELLLHHDSPVSASFNLTDLPPETQAALLFLLRHIMGDSHLPTALEEIRRHFHSRLQDRRAPIDIFEAVDFDAAALIDDMDPHSMAVGGALSSLFRGFTPRNVPATEISDTPDTVENRYVKFFLEELRQLMQRLAGAHAAPSQSRTLREIESWIDALDEELSAGHWKSVGPFITFPSNSQVLLKRQGYREILRFDLSLRMSLELPWKRSLEFADGLMGDIRPVDELYEYWCFFHMRRCLMHVCAEQAHSNQSLIENTNDGFQVKLRRGARSKVGFVYRREQGRVLYVNLFYNRRFAKPTRELDTWHGSYTANFDPDYSLEARLECDGQIQRHWLHFDAKYRVEFEDLRELIPTERSNSNQESELQSHYDTELARLHRRDDLFKMHTYRDGILSSRGAYIIFPGNSDQSNIYVRHPSGFGGRPAYLFPSVGAFSLCPGRDGNQTQVLSDFIAAILRAIFDGKPYQEETGFF